MNSIRSWDFFSRRELFHWILNVCLQGEPINKLKERVKEKIDIQEKEFEKVRFFNVMVI